MKKILVGFLLLITIAYLHCSSELKNGLNELERLSSLERNDDVVKLASSMIEKYPEEPRFYYKRGWALYSLGLNELAESDFAKCIKIDPNYADGYKGMASVFMSRSQADLAELYIDKALARAKTSDRKANILANKASLKYMQKKYDEAIRVLDEAISLRKDGSYYYIKGLIHLDQNEGEKAVALWEEAISNVNFEEVKFKHQTYHLLSGFYAGKGEKQKALEYISKAIELAPSNKQYISAYDQIKAIK